MDAREREQTIERYRGGTAAIRDALSGATEAELDIREAPGEWTAREIVHHLADAELRSTIRLRQLLAENAPVIQGYDEPLYAHKLHYDRPIATSLAAVGAARNANLDLLGHVTEWEREGTHTDSGRYTLDDWLRIYTEHAYDHAEQISRARGAKARQSAT